MTKDEALKLALEALEDLGMKHFESTGEVLYKETFTAIKEALMSGTDGAQPEQEHVSIPDCGEAGHADGACGNRQCLPSFRRNTTPPQRTWVGLTLDERIELAQDVDWAVGAYCEYAEKIEAKLKELNT